MARPTGGIACGKPSVIGCPAAISHGGVVSGIALAITTEAAALLILTRIQGHGYAMEKVEEDRRLTLFTACQGAFFMEN